MSWINGKLLGFDLETTGVDITRDRVVTASYEVRQGNEVVEQVTLLFNPGVEIPQAAVAVHGITNELAQSQGMNPLEGLEQFAAKLVSYISEGAPLVGFNVLFDISLLENELRRYGLPTVAQRLGGRFAPVIDPLILDRELDRWRKGKRKLVDLLTVYGIQVNPDELHQSDVDVSMPLTLLQAMVEKYPRIGEMQLLQLHDFQREAYHRWAVGFSQWLESKGNKPLDNLNWLA